LNLIFINNSGETFTPTHSGAIATWIWECCNVAQTAGFQPGVLSRDSDAVNVPNFPWPNSIFIDYPPAPKQPWSIYFFRLERKVRGWRHLRHSAYAGRVRAVLDRIGGSSATLFLQNDPEMAVCFARRYPRARVFHHFQNQLECKERFRQAYRSEQIVSTGCSDFTSRWIEKYYALPAGSVATLYNGVNADSISPNPKPPDGPPVINFVGRTGVEKAPDLLLRAANLLAARTKNFSLQILGANHWGRFEMDDYQRQLQTLTHDLERQGIAVRRPGHVDRMTLPAELRKAHIHVMPSRWDEPFGMATLEGMASGLATVASATGGTPEVVGDAGILFGRDDVEGLAQRLYDLVSSESLRRDLAQRARQRACQFTWSHTWQRLQQLIAA
jgi:glycosyltransferase involved in cell wall biosynthesis